MVIEGETFDDSNALALKMRDNRDLVFVHAFNDPDVIAGQGTIALEMLEDAPEIDTLPIPIGGGGLVAGMATAAKTLKPELKVYGLEAAMYPSFTAKMRGITPAIGGQTIAEGIAVKQVGEITYAVARPLVEDVFLIDEPYFERAIALYCNVEKTVAEGAGAGALAALLARPDVFRGRKCGLVLCGGNIDHPPSGQRADPRTGAGEAHHLHPHHRRRPAGSSRRRLQHHRRGRGQHHRGGAQSPRPRRASQGR